MKNVETFVLYKRIRARSSKAKRFSDVLSVFGKNCFAKLNATRSSRATTSGTCLLKENETHHARARARLFPAFLRLIKNISIIKARLVRSFSILVIRPRFFVKIQRV